MSCSGRLSFIIKKSHLFTLIPEGELIGSFSTQVISHLLLVLLLPVYVNLVKELFLPALFQAVFATVFPKASAKVLYFHELAKFFGDYFQKKMHFLGLGDRNQGKSEMFGEYEQTFEKMRKGKGRRAGHGSKMNSLLF